MYPGNKRKKVWREEKERLLKMTLEERRKEYLRDYVPLKDIPTWREELKSKTQAQSDEENTKEALLLKKSLSEKVSLYRGDITLLEIDAIVNAANSSLLGGGGVDGCIHRAAGPCLVAECRNLSGCETGQAKITCGYDLPAKYVIHTVGPIARGHISDTHKEDLANCYKSSLKLAKENLIRSIAFPCISTGIYGFPNEPAAVIALTTIKEWLSKNYHEMDRVIFCVFLEVDYKIYKKKMNEFFPADEDNEEESEMNKNAGGMEQKGQSPSPVKCKAKQTENLEDDNEGDNDMEVKQSTDEIGSQSQEADEAKPPVINSSTDGGENLCKEKESSQDSKATQEHNPMPHTLCEQDQADGPQDDSTEDDMNTQTDSQVSYMEAEETLTAHEEPVKEEKPLAPEVDKSYQDSKGEEKGAEQGKGKQTTEPMQPEVPCDTENISSNDAEMNSQVENIDEPTESQKEN
ncbi:ADP-ribose glycohydrolase MACROD2 isoform X2 [Hemicordylus capensis]|uniref:ADP-ribose glycohydrolase MACROD2 isoform X2 n=1 Tax=Hemicordylus capensis TaxID=884348 RepID=UPI00230338A1|nr:ADP-ribose glycohydrolase MACROD2 isoform X2 [Hemicordylus capensis]